MNRIILADKYGVFRTGVGEVLSREADCSVVAQCSNESGLRVAIYAFHPVLVLFGSTMHPDPSLLMQQIRDLGSRGIAMLSPGESSDPYLVAQVHGLFFRSAPVLALLECVRRVSRGQQGAHLGWEAASLLREDFVGERVRDRLTPKEMKIVALIMQGLKNKEMAFRLDTTEQVIKNCLRGVYDKIGVSDRVELALFTIQHSALAEAAAAASRLIAAA